MNMPTQSLGSSTSLRRPRASRRSLLPALVALLLGGTQGCARYGTVLESHPATGGAAPGSGGGGGSLGGGTGGLGSGGAIAAPGGTGGAAFPRPIGTGGAAGTRASCSQPPPQSVWAAPTLPSNPLLADVSGDGVADAIVTGWGGG